MRLRSTSQGFGILTKVSIYHTCRGLPVPVEGVGSCFAKFVPMSKG